MSIHKTIHTDRLLYAEGSDGCRIAIRHFADGTPGAVPVIFVHALAMTGAMWELVANHLHTDAALYAVDCRGHGLSDRPQGPYTTTLFAQDIHCVLQRLRAPKAHIVGCSMGGTVSLAFASTYPAAVASLTVVDSTAYYGDGQADIWHERGLRPQKEGFAGMLPFQVSRWFSDAYAATHPQAMRDATATFLDNSEHAYFASCVMLGTADERPGLSNYTGPATVVVGSDDYATPPAMAKEIVDHVAGATLSVLPGLRHYTPIEAPELVADAIEKVMQRA